MALGENRVEGSELKEEHVLWAMMAAKGMRHYYGDQLGGHGVPGWSPRQRSVLRGPRNVLGLRVQAGHSK